MTVQFVNAIASLQRLALAGESGEVNAHEACREIAQRLPDLLVVLNPIAWTSAAELKRFEQGYAATIWGTRMRYRDVDVPLYGTPPV